MVGLVSTKSQLTYRLLSTGFSFPKCTIRVHDMIFSCASNYGHLADFKLAKFRPTVMLREKCHHSTGFIKLSNLAEQNVLKQTLNYCPAEGAGGMRLTER